MIHLVRSQNLPENKHFLVPFLMHTYEMNDPLKEAYF